MTFDRWPQPETLRAAPDYTIGQLQAAMAEGQILTGQAVHCDTALNLHIRLGALSGISRAASASRPFSPARSGRSPCSRAWGAASAAA